MKVRVNFFLNNENNNNIKIHFTHKPLSKSSRALYKDQKQNRIQHNVINVFHNSLSRK